MILKKLALLTFCQFSIHNACFAWLFGSRQQSSGGSRPAAVSASPNAHFGAFAVEEADIPDESIPVSPGCLRIDDNIRNKMADRANSLNSFDRYKNPIPLFITSSPSFTIGGLSISNTDVYVMEFEKSRVLFKKPAPHYIQLFKYDDDGTFVEAHSMSDAKIAEDNLYKYFGIELLDEVRGAAYASGLTCLFVKCDGEVCKDIILPPDSLQYLREAIFLQTFNPLNDEPWNVTSYRMGFDRFRKKLIVKKVDDSAPISYRPTKEHFLLIKGHEDLKVFPDFTSFTTSITPDRIGVFFTNKNTATLALVKSSKELGIAEIDGSRVLFYKESDKLPYVRLYKVEGSEPVPANSAQDTKDAEKNLMEVFGLSDLDDWLSERDDVLYARIIGQKNGKNKWEILSKDKLTPELVEDEDLYAVSGTDAIIVRCDYLKNKFLISKKWPKPGSSNLQAALDAYKASHSEKC